MNTKALTMPLCAAQMTRFTLLVTMGFLLAAHGKMRAASTGAVVQKPITAEDLRAAAEKGRIAFRLPERNRFA